MIMIQKVKHNKLCLTHFFNKSFLKNHKWGHIIIIYYLFLNTSSKLRYTWLTHYAPQTARLLHLSTSKFGKLSVLGFVIIGGVLSVFRAHRHQEGEDVHDRHSL